MNLNVRKLLSIFPLLVLLLAVVELQAGQVVSSNATFISINDHSMPPAIATPYPSGILVLGLTGQVVGKATVTLRGFSHEFPSDVSILLVGPQGQKAILMAEVGGQNKFSVTNLNITLDDDTTNTLPVYSALTSGTFMPRNGYLTFGEPGLPFNFPVPAPAGTSNATAALSVFKNTDPNGVWNLFVVDNVSGDAGSISNGWVLNLTTGYPLKLVKNAQNVVLSWTTNAQNYLLQSTGNPSDASSWRNIITTPSVVAGRYTVTNPMLYQFDFYRLIHP